MGWREVEDKKVNRPISWDKGKLSKKESVERLTSLLRVFHRMNHVRIFRGKI